MAALLGKSEGFFFASRMNETLVSHGLNVPDLKLCTWRLVICGPRTSLDKKLDQWVRELSLRDCEFINCNPHQVLGPSLVPSTCGVLMREEKWKDHVWRTRSCWTATCSCNWVLQEHCLKRLLSVVQEPHLSFIYTFIPCVCPSNPKLRKINFSLLIFSNLLWWQLWEFGDAIRQYPLVACCQYSCQLSAWQCMSDLDKST